MGEQYYSVLQHPSNVVGERRCDSGWNLQCNIQGCARDLTDVDETLVRLETVYKTASLARDHIT